MSSNVEWQGSDGTNGTAPVADALMLAAVDSAGIPTMLYVTAVPESAYPAGFWDGFANSDWEDVELGPYDAVRTRPGQAGGAVNEVVMFRSEGYVVTANATNVSSDDVARAVASLRIEAGE